MSEGEIISEEYEDWGYWDGECYDDCDECEIRDECEERRR